MSLGKYATWKLRNLCRNSIKIFLTKNQLMMQFTALSLAPMFIKALHKYVKTAIKSSGVEASKSSGENCNPHLSYHCFSLFNLFCRYFLYVSFISSDLLSR